VNATPRRLGRPPASSSVDTRRRILEVARESFAEFGYGVTTNKFVATRAGITTGALYHYFDSKHDLYVAVYAQVWDHVGRHLGAALASGDTFEGQLTAVLTEARRLNLEDSSLARFLGAARIDIQRHDDLARVLLAEPPEARTLFETMVATGIATGELAARDRQRMLALLRALFVGLVDGVSPNSRQHLAAIEGILALVRGELVSRPATARATRRAGRGSDGSSSPGTAPVSHPASPSSSSPSARSAG